MKINMIINAALTVVLAHLALGVILWLRVRNLYSYPGLLGFPVIGNIYYFYRALFLGSFESLRAYFFQIVKQYGKNGICFLYAYSFHLLVVVYGPQVLKQIGFHPNLKDKPFYPYQSFKNYMNGPFSRHRTDDSWKMRRKEYNCILRKQRVESTYFKAFLKSADKLVDLMFASSSALDIRNKALEVTQSVTMENTDSYHPLPIWIASRTEKSKKFEERVVAELQEVFLTSSITVASTMSSTITYLAVLPQIQERAWKEQYEIFGDESREPTLEDLEQMKFLERVIKESLRFSCPPFVGKQASEDIEVDGTIIPKNTIVIYLLEFLHKDPKYWKNPEVFDPDRFLEENEGLKYSYAPFGVGVRSCPGIHFAMTQKLHCQKY
ncbi:cytochrome P450 6k1 isoform X4 [Halyomorpha halys]|uniref:cytochrome P450 6k1 isoform X4 n=1 Tax=Halyomorpha halys TaxID=286706 RepID=UPI0034D378A6